jgi:anti-sigma regulatory factor (Ser/Thr protein kinase)
MTSARRFPNDVGSPKAARQFALEKLPGYAPEVLEVVELLVSELATNSVRHTDSGFEVRICSAPNRIRVSVTDSGPGRPVERPSDPTAPSGRGLALMKMLSSSSGVSRSRAAAGGKTVWFVLDIADHQFRPVPAKAEMAGGKAGGGGARGVRPRAADRGSRGRGDRPRALDQGSAGPGRPRALDQGSRRCVIDELAAGLSRARR